jgi:hypothetical protein
MLRRSKTEYMSVISALPCRRRGMLDSMVTWYPRKTLSLLGIDAEW